MSFENVSFNIRIASKVSKNVRATYLHNKKTRKWICIDGRLKHAFPSRDLCLETGARLKDYQYRCHFNPSTAENILQDGKLFKMILVIVA